MGYQSIKIDSGSFVTGRPESISIKRNLNGTYNLYALLRSECVEGEKNIKTLIGLRSKNLYWQKDFDMGVKRYEYTFVGDGEDMRTHPLMYDSMEILYNLKFSKSIGTLIEFQILNEGDGIMNYNVFEGLEKYTVQVNVAGFDREEIDIIHEGDIIRVRTQPTSKLAIEDEECMSKSFEKHRSECEIYLPKIESVEAVLKNGILHLSISKAFKGERIEIKTE